MSRHIVEYNGIKYPTRYIENPKEGGVMVATTELQDVLIVNDEYVDEVAKIIDEGIFFYVSPEEFLLGDEELGELIDEILN
jgi:hypothetical protein